MLRPYDLLVPHRTPTGLVGRQSSTTSALLVATLRRHRMRPRKWRTWLAAAAVSVRARRGVRHVPFPAAHAATRRRQAHRAFEKQAGIGGTILREPRASRLRQE
ncbi:hypothetical protein HPB50_003601 [Hyalomma asiaticum]|uniref:Uncharacterized protein n=1 Tax=Hyalomma asiaticum TaxID=266040 RepID=A0ACB7T0A7_HYAAI|nr:hypothetical protein HPB50_003601 [Hyalomma asiaticum]